MGYGDHEDTRKKKIAVLSFSSILLVAAYVGAVTFDFNNQNSGKNSGPEATAAQTQTLVSLKAVQSICRHVNYQETYKESLKVSNSSNPKKLVKAAFQVTLRTSDSSSSLLKDAKNDARTADALTICKYLLNVSIDDFQISFDKVETLT